MTMRKLLGHDLLVRDSYISTQVNYNNSSHEHTHDFYEFFYVVHGSVTHVINGENDKMEIGDLRFMVPGKFHAVISNNQSVQRDILIDNTFFEQVCQILSFSDKTLQTHVIDKKVKVSISEVTEIERLLNDFSKDTNIQKKRCLAMEVVSKLLSKFFSVQQTPSEYNAYPEIIKTILALFTTPEALGKNITQIIKHKGYSPIYISRLFKKHVGITISDYMKDIRLSHTAFYLENTNYSLQQICNLVGLDNLSYLNKIFKEKYGTTPIKYRKMTDKESVNPIRPNKRLKELKPLKDSKHDQHALHIVNED